MMPSSGKIPVIMLSVFLSSFCSNSPELKSLKGFAKANLCLDIGENMKNISLN